jgi:hypothetical protein
MIVPVALMTAAMGLQRLERHLLGPAPAADDALVGRRDVTARRGSAARAAVPPASPRR